MFKVTWLVEDAEDTTAWPVVALKDIEVADPILVEVFEVVLVEAAPVGFCPCIMGIFGFALAHFPKEVKSMSILISCLSSVFRTKPFFNFISAIESFILI